MRLIFRLRTRSAGLFQDMRRCRIGSDERFLMYDNGEVDDAVHFLIEIIM